MCGEVGQMKERQIAVNVNIRDMYSISILT